MKGWEKVAVRRSGCVEGLHLFQKNYFGHGKTIWRETKLYKAAVKGHL